MRTKILVKSRHAGACALLSGCLALGGCVTRGDDFPTNLNWIQKDKTKQEDVKLVLGEPYMIGSSSGQPTWTYGYYQYRLIGDSFTKELKFYWSPDRTVERYNFSSSFPDDTGRSTEHPKPPAKK